jgi:hypothetical protein
LLKKRKENKEKKKRWVRNEKSCQQKQTEEERKNARVEKSTWRKKRKE